MLSPKLCHDLDHKILSLLHLYDLLSLSEINQYCNILISRAYVCEALARIYDNSLVRQAVAMIARYHNLSRGDVVALVAFKDEYSSPNDRDPRDAEGNICFDWKPGYYYDDAHTNSEKLGPLYMIGSYNRHEKCQYNTDHYEKLILCDVRNCELTVYGLMCHSSFHYQNRFIDLEVTISLDDIDQCDLFSDTLLSLKGCDFKTDFVEPDEPIIYCTYISEDKFEERMDLCVLQLKTILSKMEYNGNAEITITFRTVSSMGELTDKLTNSFMHQYSLVNDIIFDFQRKYGVSSNEFILNYHCLA